MTSLIETAIAFLSAHPHVAYWAVFALATSEAIPVIGVVVPGTALILALSALVPSGVVVLWPLLIAATAGAIAGDGLSFWFGHRYKSQMLGIWPFSRYPAAVARSEAFIERHGGKSIFLARFTPGVRTFVPVMAGMLGMPVSRFYRVNVFSALVWAPAHVLPGVFVGAAFGVLGEAAKPVAILLVVAIAAGWIVSRLVRWALRRGIPLLTAGIDRIQAWANARDDGFGRKLGAALDMARHEARTIGVFGLFLLGAAWLFFGILEDVISGDPLVLVDTAIFRALQDLRTGPADTVMIAITEFGDTTVVIAVTIGVLLWLVAQRAWRTAAYWLVAIAGASALNTAIKVALHRARPNETLYSGWSAFSFPSGHSTVNLVLYGFLAILVAYNLRRRWRVSVALASATVITLIAFSRLYLGAHWFSDVAGGLAFGSAWLAILGFAYTRRPSEPIHPGGLFAYACVGLIAVGGFHSYRTHEADLERYTIESRQPVLRAENWWATDWRRQPARRIDLTGEIAEPINFQWAGSLEGLETALAGVGWSQAAPWTSLSALKWLTPDAAAADLPVMPEFSNGRLPSLMLVRPQAAGPGNSRLVLRIWRVDLRVVNGKAEPLWIGAAVEERVDGYYSLITLYRTQPDFDAPRRKLAEAMAAERTVLRDRLVEGPGWDGKVLLATQQGN
ncbi:bifunctional DedA family/phosphatase PAP2 family protein [Oricola cellulosilytica]|uniref:Phosphatase PAP2 family protein n=1 Tax=Oricola cellulosilytica TaxID=1429082 RepID=A0A4R0PA40_9HYPH|nr:bifunctional DedA family/phosphatase PAP2 family protein [Oricola cellulosilytica]TCD14120.1 phosphatase PAP2 family protein [Oricola cellulosilytica]